MYYLHSHQNHNMVILGTAAGEIDPDHLQHLYQFHLTLSVDRESKALP